MPVECEQSFRKGMAALKAGNSVEALEHFQTAVTQGRERANLRSRMHYLSYYGLSLALAHRPSEHAIGACAKAAAVDPFDLALQHNLATVYVLARKPTRALAVLEQLDRNHLLNRWLGPLRASVAGPRPA
jgi:thioredoxin-like negative regulator of GroEL